MADTSVSGTVDVRSSDSRSRVTFDLMEKIAQYEPKDQNPKTRQYWLQLYAQCDMVTRGYDSTDALKIK